MKTYTFYVQGTHCPSCKILIEDVIGEHDFVQSVAVDLDREIAEIVTDTDHSHEDLILLLAPHLTPHGYQLVVERAVVVQQGGGDIWKALPIGIGVLILFFLLQKTGILNFGIGGTPTFTSSFILGLIASVSSCLAVVGGLVLSLSARVAQNEGSVSRRMFTLFHGGRLVAFALLGGLLGLIGQAIGVNFVFSAILGLLAALVMILLGLHLVGVIRRNRVAVSGGLFNRIRKVEHSVWAPLVIGAGTFFLPCGFTQSMQLAALSSGTFASGFTIMLAFALGTLPVLGLLSFGSLSFSQSRHAPLFFKVAGVVVVGFGLFAFMTGLMGLGVLPPVINL